MGRKTVMNNLTSPELIAQVNPDNIDLMNDFLEYLESTQRAESTIEQYRRDLYIAFVWSLQHNNNTFYCDWTKRNIVKLQNWLLNENQNSPARVRRFKSTLSSLGNYVENVLDDEYPNFRNIIRKIESPLNQPVREKTVMTNEDIEKMLDYFVDKKQYKKACGIALMAYSGRRKAEICRFRVSDFDEDKLICEGSLWKSDPIKTKGRGKGKFLNCYTLAHKFKPYLDMWMEERERLGIESEWLFQDNSDPLKQMNATEITSWMRTVSNVMDMDIYAHAFRHRYTTMLSEEGIPDGVIKEILGWTDIGLVSVYNDRTTDDTLDMYFGADGIKKVEQKGLSDL